MKVTTYKVISKYVSLTVLTLIIFYQRYISCNLPHMCKYKPTCSEYMRRAIIYHGVIKGFFLGVNRITRCHPFSKGGADDVPLLYQKYFKK